MDFEGDLIKYCDSKIEKVIGDFFWVGPFLTMPTTIILKKIIDQNLENNFKLHNNPSPNHQFCHIPVTPRPSPSSPLQPTKWHPWSSSARLYSTSSARWSRLERRQLPRGTKRRASPIKKRMKRTSPHFTQGWRKRPHRWSNTSRIYRTTRWRAALAAARIAWRTLKLCAWSSRQSWPRERSPQQRCSRSAWTPLTSWSILKRSRMCWSHTSGRWSASAWKSPPSSRKYSKRCRRQSSSWMLRLCLRKLKRGKLLVRISSRSSRSAARLFSLSCRACSTLTTRTTAPVPRAWRRSASTRWPIFYSRRSTNTPT